MTDSFTIIQEYEFQPNVPKERQKKFETELNMLTAKYQFDFKYFKVMREDEEQGDD